MPLDIDLGDVDDPDVSLPCPFCGGEVAVWIGLAGRDDVCTIQGVVHIQPEADDA